MTLMQRGTSLFTDKALAAAGRDVTFLRGSTELPLVAWITESVYQVTDASGVPVQITTRDYKFRTSDLSLDIRVGDRFKETINGETVITEVMPMGDSPGNSWVDSDGHITIAHCKHIEIQK